MNLSSAAYGFVNVSKFKTSVFPFKTTALPKACFLQLTTHGNFMEVFKAAAMAGNGCAAAGRHQPGAVFD